MLAGLWHRAVGGGDDENRAVHLRCARDHILHVIGVARAIDVRVMALLALVFHVRGGNRDAALLLFRRGVDRIVGARGREALLREHGGDCGSQRRLAVIDVTNGADVYVRLVPFKFVLSHLDSPFLLN